MSATGNAEMLNMIASGQVISCPNCGAINKPTSKFCKACGTKITPPEPAVTPEPKTESVFDAVDEKPSAPEKPKVMSMDDVNELLGLTVEDEKKPVSEPSNGNPFGTAAEVTPGDVKENPFAVAENTAAESEPVVENNNDENDIFSDIFAPAFPTEEKPTVEVPAEKPEIKDAPVQTPAFGAVSQTPAEPEKEVLKDIPVGAPAKNNEPFSSEATSVLPPVAPAKQNVVKEEQPEKEDLSAFAMGLPKWDIVPPDIVVRRH